MKHCWYSLANLNIDDSLLRLSINPCTHSFLSNKILFSIHSPSSEVLLNPSSPSNSYLTLTLTSNLATPPYFRSLGLSLSSISLLFGLLLPSPSHSQHITSRPALYTPLPQPHPQTPIPRPHLHPQLIPMTHPLSLPQAPSTNRPLSHLHPESPYLQFQKPNPCLKSQSKHRNRSAEHKA